MISHINKQNDFYESMTQSNGYCALVLQQIQDYAYSVAF